MADAAAAVPPAPAAAITETPPAGLTSAKVRELVIDALTLAQLRQLRTASRRILDRVKAIGG